MLLSIGRREELFGIGRLRLFLDGFRSGAGAVLAFALLLGNGSSIGVTLTRVDTSCSRSMLIGLGSPLPASLIPVMIFLCLRQMTNNICSSPVLRGFR